ncbi:hypothetical protein Hanom_Chr06g00571281 [Helianthus anomalus]
MSSVQLDLLKPLIKKIIKKSLLKHKIICQSQTPTNNFFPISSFLLNSKLSMK